MESLDYWRLCDDLTIVQAALLLAGFVPEEYMENIEHNFNGIKPAGYDACKTAIGDALRKGEVLGNFQKKEEYNDNGNFIGYIDGTVDYIRSTVDVATLKKWLRSRGISTGFFFPDVKDVPDYLDPSNSRYAKKLAAAVYAWLAVTDPGSKSPKQALVKWLRENASRFDLVNDAGKPIGQAVADCSKMANWQTTGGAPKTPNT